MTTYMQTGMPRSAVRHRPINPTQQTTSVPTPRASAHPSRVLRRWRQGVPHDDALIDELTSSRQVDTYEDEEVAPSTRTGYQQAMQYRSPRGSRWHPRNWHQLVWVGLTLLLVLAFCWISTAGLAWRDATFIDPGKYGPTHGDIVMGVFGGSDSQAQPSKLIGMNNNGRVEVIMLHANDPSKSQILVGPDLIATNFPDPTHANVDLEVGDFDHDGNLDLKVTVLSTIYDKPLNNYGQAYILYGDGQGNLKQRQQ